MIDILSAEGIKGFLPEEVKKRLDIAVLHSIGSTNSLLREEAQNGAKEGRVVIAGEQTSGRGRKGRAFFSPGNTGIYMSLLLKPEILPEDAVQITTAAAVAVCRAFERLGLQQAKIKWVNDIFVNNKKVCGILTEGAVSTCEKRLDYAILGVGINVYEPENGFPEEIKNIAGAVFCNRKEGLRNTLVAFFLEEFYELYENIDKRMHSKEYIDRSFIVGRSIKVIVDNGERDAVAIGIDENCGLTVEYSNGEKEILNSGEISVRMV